MIYNFAKQSIYLLILIAAALQHYFYYNKNNAEKGLIENVLQKSSCFFQFNKGK